MVGDYRVREFIETDFPNVFELWLDLGLTNTQRADSLLTLLNTFKVGGICFILENTITLEIIGTAWITNDGRRLYLHHVGIKNKFQGKKLSHLLMNASLDFAKKQNLQMKLEVHEKNKIAINLYEKAGFNYLGDYKLYIIRNYEKI